MHQDKVTKILGAIKNGTAKESDRQDLILGHIGLAISIARRIGRRYPREIEDLVAVAKLELTEVVNRVFTGEKEMWSEYLGKFLTTSISNRCKDALEIIRTMHMPGRTIRHKFVGGLNPKHEVSELLCQSGLSASKKLLIMRLPIVYQDSMLDFAKEYDEIQLETRINNLLYRLLPIPKMTVALDDDPHADKDYLEYCHAEIKASYSIPEARPELGLEIRELLEKSVSSPIEEKILRMREEGYTYQEIAPKVGMSFNSVCNKVNAIAERFDYYDKL